MNGTGKTPRPYLLRIAFHRLLDRGSEIAEAFDEFRHARRKSEHVLEHKDLPIAGGAGADADGRNIDLGRDAAAERLGNGFKDDGKSAGLRHRTGGGFDRRPIAFFAALGAE